MLVVPILSSNKGISRVFGNKSRYDTLTDVVFLSDNRVVCADRQDKLLYLIDIDYTLSTSKIIHSIETPYNVDLMTNIGNTIYLANLNNYLTVCEVRNGRLTFIRNITLASEFLYHGLCINPNNQNELFLTSTRKHNLLTILNLRGNTYKHYTIPRLENSFLKDVVFVDDKRVLIVATDNGPKPALDVSSITYKSYVNLYTYSSDKFTFIDGITYDNCHVDAVEFRNGIYYVTAQMNDNGVILRGHIEDNFLIPLSDISTADFPHGLAVSPSGYLGYTSYSTSSLYVLDCNNVGLALP